MTFSTWSQTAASNTSVGGISTDGTVTLVKQIDNMFRGMMAELAVARDDGTIAATGERGYLFGLTLSNNAGDATNDIDIAAGECVTSDSPYWRMALASALTKRLDAAWAVGTNQGGLDTGSITNGPYHIWLIQRSDTLVVDALFSASPTSPTMPANYDRKRRLGTITRAAGAIDGFTQIGDEFLRSVPAVNQAGATFTTTASLIVLSVPTGMKVDALVTVEYSANTTIYGYVSSPDQTDVAAGASAFNMLTVSNSTVTVFRGHVRTNTAGQIRVRTDASTGATGNVLCHGWRDTRGRI